MIAHGLQVSKSNILTLNLICTENNKHFLCKRPFNGIELKTDIIYFCILIMSKRKQRFHFITILLLTFLIKQLSILYFM